MRHAHPMWWRRRKRDEGESVSRGSERTDWRAPRPPAEVKDLRARLTSEGYTLNH